MLYVSCVVTVFDITPAEELAQSPKNSARLVMSCLNGTKWRKQGPLPTLPMPINAGVRSLASGKRGGNEK